MRLLTCSRRPRLPFRPTRATRRVLLVLLTGAEATCGVCLRCARKPQPPAMPLRPGRVIVTNGVTVPGPRTLPMLRALADNPRGLTTPDLAELIVGSYSSWVNALGSVRVLMLKQEKQGRVVQAGTVPAGGRTRPSVLWRITEEGMRYVREHTSVG